MMMMLLLVVTSWGKCVCNPEEGECTEVDNDFHGECERMDFSCVVLSARAVGSSVFHCGLAGPRARKDPKLGMPRGMGSSLPQYAVQLAKLHEEIGRHLLNNT